MEVINFITREKFESIIENKILIRRVFLVFLPLTIFLDFSSYRTIGVLYIFLMIVVGLAWHNISVHILISGSIVFLRYLFSPLGFPNWDILLSQFTSYFLVSFSMMTLLQKYTNQKTSVLLLTSVLAKSLDSRDPYTANHSENVAVYSKMIAKEMGFSPKQLENIFNGALLHDIGKIGIPEAILTKNTRLTHAEFDKIKEHPEIGYHILKLVPTFRKEGILDIVLYHHERVDGKGYPEGLMGERIPQYARIVAVADAFDAITTTRTYRESHDVTYAVEEIKKNIDSQFDRDVVNAFVRVIEKQKTNASEG